MRVLVYGAGAVGGYLGGKLALSGNDVTLIARPTIAAAVNRDGLLITEGGRTRCARVTAVNELPAALAQDSPYDLIVLAMKSYDLGEAVARLAEANPATACVMSTQNGIGLEEIIAAGVGEKRTLAGSVTIPISRGQINHLAVEREGRGLGLAPVEAGQPVDHWVEFFLQAGIRAGAVGNFRAMKWSKAFLNIMGNATSAILNRPPAELYRLGSIFDLEMRMLHEMLAVMKRKGLPIINLPGATARPLAWSLANLPQFLRRIVFQQVIVHGRGDKMPSFHIDLAGGKVRSEVSFHNGAIATEGKRLGVSVPVNAALTDLLLGLTQGKLPREMFDGRPERLLEVVGDYEKGEVLP